MRPRYEQLSDLRTEEAIADAVCAAFGCEHYKFSKRKADSGIDRVFVRNRTIVAVAEIKNRPSWKPEYDTVILGLTKVMKIVQAARAAGVPGYFIVRLHDNIYLTEVSEAKFWEVGIGGRYDRNDQDDVELCCRIPFNEFRPIFS